MWMRNCVLWSVFLVFFFLCSHGWAQEASLLTGAKAEGRVIWYTGSGLVMAQAVANAFEKKYPFIKVDVVRSSEERLHARIAKEKQAGKVLFDVANSQHLPLMHNLNVIAPYSPPGATAMSPKYKDPDGYWVGLHLNYFVLAYNTQLVPKDQAPRDWGDLLDSTWKGRIGLEPEDFQWLGGMMEYLGEEKARKLLIGLARQEIRWHRGHTQVAQLNAAGEFALAVSYAHRIEEMKKQGSPIDWVPTTKPILADSSKVGLSAAPPHPNAARLLLHFLISKEGQTEVYKAGSIPAFAGVLPKDSPLDPTRLVIHPVSLKITLNLERYAKEFEQIFGSRR
jgi:iron(III) transport system substrate-binding protein